VFLDFCSLFILLVVCCRIIVHKVSISFEYQGKAIGVPVVSFSTWDVRSRLLAGPLEGL